MTYCSQVWKPHLIKDITCLENIRRCATKFILNDYHTDYRSRLISLNLLPLMYFLELLDILFFIKCLKSPDPSFPILNFVSFSAASTRSASYTKLIHQHRQSTLSQHSYFSRLIRTWNILPPIDLSLPLSTTKLQLKKFFWSYFLSHFDPAQPCTFHIACPCSRCYQVSIKTNFN